MKLISVIVPVYKVEAYLDRCVQSIVDQTYQNLEIILVDDGSPDNCPAMCDAWAEKDNRIRVIHKENGGLSDARNAGLREATGEFVGFIDSDDWIDIRFYEVLYRNAVDKNCQISECSFVATNGQTVCVNATGDVIICSAVEAMERHLRDIQFKQVVWNKIYHRDVITVPFEVGKFHEDVFWTYQIIANCKKLAHVNVPLYFYFQRNESIMGQNYSVKRLDAVEAAAQRCRFVIERFPQLASLAKYTIVGDCMYHHQQLLRAPYIDKKYRVWVQNLARIGDGFWKSTNSFSTKQIMWLRGYLTTPNIICRIRNLLRIGLD